MGAMRKAEAGLSGASSPPFYRKVSGRPEALADTLSDASPGLFFLEE